MTIEKLEALERAATSGPWYVKWDFNVFGVGERLTASCGGHTSNRLDGGTTENTANTQFVAAARNSMPALLAVAKAAKGLRATDSKGDWCQMTEQAMEDRERFTAELDAALAQLEATP